MRKWLILLVVLVVVAIGGGWYVHRSQKPAALYRTAPVSRGDLLATIAATGTVEPEEVVDVGAQIAGQIEYFGKDPHHDGKLIDYGSEVDEGTVLAHIDESLYAADVASAQAQVDNAKANVLKAQADLGQMNAKVSQTGNDWKRAQQAGASAGLSESDMDSYKANYETANANLAVGHAAVLLAETAQAQSEAELKRAQRNLSYCTITSPVKGTIIDRRVNIGQTVVAALNAPSLFLIAKDLKKIQVWASVNEADIGNIHAGQPVTFTIDAFHGQAFTGSVNKIRYNATTTQNVVTYTVEISTDNSDGKLLPYLTANVQFELDKRVNVMQVPNAALRWVPETQQVAEDVRRAAADAPPSTDHHQSAAVWIVDGKFVRPIEVQPGLSDGINTEIESDDLKEGEQVVVGDIVADEEGTSGSPFLPQFGKSKK
jgi:HlyD family secretion protein